MPDIEQIAEQVNKLGTAWETFKTKNDEDIAEIKKRGTADPLNTEQLTRINASLDEHKERLDKLQAAGNRTPIGGNDKKETGDIVEHKAAFQSYARKGNDRNLAELESKALSVHSDPDGGFLVTSTMSSEIIKIVYESSPMRPYASVETIATDSLDILDDRGQVASGWVAETADRPETGTAQFGLRNIPTHELYAQPKATQKLLDDSGVDIEAWLAEKVSDIFSRTENAAFFTGDGVGKPRGILTYAAGTAWSQVEQVASGTSADFDADDLFGLYFSLKEGYAKRSTWFMNRLTVKKARLLKEATTGQYIWSPGLAVGAPDTLIGQPVVKATDMPVPAADSLSLALGDFKAGYQIVDRIGIRTLRDPFTSKPFVKFYTTKRVGGDVKNFEAFKVMKLGS